MPHSSAVQGVYCPACNEYFDHQGESHCCPRCGCREATPEQSPLAATLMMRAGDRYDTHAETALAATDLHSLVGRDLGDYHCESLLGRGGMGYVFLASHRGLHRRCALKVVSPQMVREHDGFLERFREEGRAAASLNHPHVVAVHAIGAVDGYHFLEMEFVPGRSLQELISTQGALPPVRATSMLAMIADGLAAAHRAHIVHGDLKPDNVLLTSQELPKIGDFGLAKKLAAKNIDVRGTLCGTPHFMAPELFRGTPASTASDVYALGVCYYLLLTGRYPFQGRTLTGLMQQIVQGRVPPVGERVPELPPEMEVCISRLTAPNPADRPADGESAWQELLAVLGQVRDPVELIAEAFPADSGVVWQREGQSCRLEVPLSNGRRQSVQVSPHTSPAGERLVRVVSVCCDVQPGWFERALRMNGQIPHGGLAVCDGDGRPQFVVLNHHLRATVVAEELRRSVLEVARTADQVEKTLTGLDQN